MPFLAEVTLEYGDVETKGVTREEIIRAAREKPRDTRDWYLTLRRADDPNEEFMDATMEDDSTFGVRVFEDGKKYRTGAAIREELLEPLFLSFYEHDRSWKTLCAWEEVAEKPKFSLMDLFKR
jgi:hypothetical protein